jgi:hypothetical protein
MSGGKALKGSMDIYVSSSAACFRPKSARSGKETLRGYLRHSNIHISVNSCDQLFSRADQRNRRGKDKRWVAKETLNWGELYATWILYLSRFLYYWLISMIWFRSAKQKGGAAVEI